MLFLLNVADNIATGPMARSDWKMVLLTELFLKVRHILERGVLASPDATKKIEGNKRRILDTLTSQFSENEILHLIDQVPSRYFLNTNMEDILRHFRLALTLGEKRLSWKLQKLAHAPVTKVILCTYDRPGLFTKMVGVFTLNNIKVLEARIFTLKNGLAFDIYGVTNPVDPYREAEIWSKVNEDIRLALEDRLPLNELIQKKEKTALYPERYEGLQTKKVHINNEISDFFSVIEVRSDVGVELLYNLAKEMFSVGLDIRFAKFNSDEEKMTGDFYVRDSFGQKILEQEQIDEIKRDILGILK
jgi:[protein-PII] uridylyltransferase